jgi:hypothetical protein
MHDEPTPLLDISPLTTDAFESVATVTDLDIALNTLMRIVDPDNKHDLGGHAAHWFDTNIGYQAPADNGWTEEKAAIAWPYLDPWERVNHLKVFFVAAANLVDPRGGVLA